jgi:hypothetical protein
VRVHRTASHERSRLSEATQSRGDKGVTGAHIMKGPLDFGGGGQVIFLNMHGCFTDKSGT